VIAKRGVCGAGFRWIYRDFLREAEEIVPSLRELKLSEKMDLIGHRWSDISMLLKEISEKEEPDLDLLHLASEKARELYELEEEFYSTVIDKIS